MSLSTSSKMRLALWEFVLEVVQTPSCFREDHVLLAHAVKVSLNVLVNDPVEILLIDSQLFGHGSKG